MAAISNAAAQTRMRLWVIHPDDYPVTIVARSFASRSGQKSSGRIQIDVIGTDVIRDQAEAQKMLKDGKLEMGESNLAMLSEAVPSMKALNLPFLFSDSKHMFSLLDGEMGAPSKSVWVKSASSAWAGTTAAHARLLRRRQARQPARFQGPAHPRDRLRSVQRKWHRILAPPRCQSRTRTSPQRSSAKEIDCAENNLPSFVSSGHYKYAKHMLLTDHGSAGGADHRRSELEEAREGRSDADRGRRPQVALLMRELWNKRVEESRAIAVKAGVTLRSPARLWLLPEPHVKPLHQKYWKDPEMRTELVAILSNR